MSSSPKPTKFFNIVEYVKEKEAEVDPKDEEKVLASLSRGAAWKLLKGYIDNLMADLDAKNSIAMSQGMSFEEIGKNTVVIDMAKSILRLVINKVEDAGEAREGK